MKFFDKIGKFIDSPQGAAMAAALLKNKGTLGEGLGNGLLGMQQVDQQEFNNKHKNSLLDLQKEGLGLRREGLENQKLSTQAYIDNMRHQQGMAYQRLKMMMDEQNRQRQAMSNIQNLIGNPETFAEAPIPLKNAGEMVPQGTGSGLLGGKLSHDDFRKEAAKSLLGIGDYQSALSLLAPPKKGGFGQPREVLGPDGTPMLVQVNPEGEVRPVEGFQPVPRKGLEVTTPDGTVVRTGGSGGIGTATKNLAEKQITQAQDLKKSIHESMKYYNPDYLRAKGKLKDAYINAKDFLGVPLSKSEEKFTGNQVAFEHMVGRGFHRYMQIMVGSRPGQKLYEYMLKSYPNMRLRPAKFESSMKSIETNLDDTIKTYNDLLKSGKFTEEQAQEAAAKKLEEGFNEVFDNLVENGPEIRKAFKAEEDPLGIRR